MVKLQRARGTPVTRQFSWLGLALALLAGCTTPDTCPDGQRRACLSDQNCRCGPTCRTQDDCSGRDVCLHFADMPQGEGACVDFLWVYGNQPPCNPLCRSTQACVQWTPAGASCADKCDNATTCSSGCCVPLTNGSRVCAPDASQCAGRCDPGCGAAELCVMLDTVRCLAKCTVDTDCPDSCCLGLQGGGGACAPAGGALCPPPAEPACPAKDACAFVQSASRLAAEGGCGTYGLYEGSVGNFCGGELACLACWWSPATASYSDCEALSRLPDGVTEPAGAGRCAPAALPDPPLRVRCVDAWRLDSGQDCLGHGPL